MIASRAIRIRRFQSSDLAPMQQLIETTIDLSYAAVYPPRAVAFFKSFHGAERLLDRVEKGTVLIAEIEGRVIGTGSLVDGEIFAVFVHPDCQGSGLGKTLMTKLEEEARANGVRESVLSVSLPSRTFYERLGYQITEERTRDVGGGEQLNFWKARKSLADDPA